MGFHGDIARRELPLIEIEEFEVLLEGEEVFGPIVTGQGGDDLGLGRVTPIVPMVGQLRWVALAGHDVAQDAQAGHSGNVADHQRELHVHLDQRFLHALHEGACALDERGPMPEIPRARPRCRLRGGSCRGVTRGCAGRGAIHRRRHHSCDQGDS